MLKRVLYHIRKSGSHIILTFVIYTFVLFFFCVSVLITNIIDLQKFLFTDNLDLYVSVGSSLQLFQKGMNNISADELLNQNNATLKDYNQLKKTKGVTWSCLEQKTNVRNGIWTALYQEESKNPYFADAYYRDIEDYYRIQDTWKTMHFSILSELYGVSTGEFSELYFNQYSIEEGRTFTEQDMSDDVCVLVGDFSMFHLEEDGTITKTKLSVGDTVPISIVGLDENGEIRAKHVKDLRIVGIMKVNNESSQMNYRVYMPITLFQELEEIYQSSVKITNPDQLYVSESPVFRTDTVEHLNGLLQNIENTEEYQNGFFSYYATTDQYASLLADIYTTVQGFNIISKVCVAIVVIVAIAVALINLRFRQKEDAILYAMGEGKNRLALQNLLENLILLIPALCISMPLALYSARKITAAMFAQHIDTETYTKVLSEELVGKEIIPTTEEINTFIQFSNIQLLSIGLVVCLILAISWLMSRRDSRHMNVRELLS